MIDFVSLLLHTEIFRFITLVLVCIFVITCFEVLCCITKAMDFQIEKLPNYRNWFIKHYRITAKRNAISWKASKHNWFLWSREKLSNLKIYFVSQSPYFQLFGLPKENIHQTLKHNFRIVYINAKNTVFNVIKYLTFFATIPVYTILIITSVIERFYRFLLEPIAFFIFLVSAKIKENVVYYFKGSLLVVHSHIENFTCPEDIIYRKPTIQIRLYDPQYCPDYLQKDNINHFTSTFKNLIPPQQRIKIKTEVCYWKSVDNLQVELPLTINYLRASFSRLTHIQTNKEVS